MHHDKKNHKNKNKEQCGGYNIILEKNNRILDENINFFIIIKKKLFSKNIDF